MRKLQNTIAQLNEKNFDVLNNADMNMLKGGSNKPTPCNCCCTSSTKSKKSKKIKKAKSVKSIKNHSGNYNNCGW